jgi:hypothetical protein
MKVLRTLPFIQKKECIDETYSSIWQGLIRKISKTEMTMLRFKEIVEKHTAVEWCTSEPTLKKLGLDSACESVEQYFDKLVPTESYKINGITFLNYIDIINFNKEHMPACIGFPYGYICFAIEPDWECWVFEKETGRIMYVGHDGITQDYVVDVNDTFDKIELNKGNFRKGVLTNNIHANILDFLNNEVLKEW